MPGKLPTPRDPNTEITRRLQLVDDMLDAPVEQDEAYWLRAGAALEARAIAEAAHLTWEQRMAQSWAGLAQIQAILDEVEAENAAARAERERRDRIRLVES